MSLLGNYDSSILSAGRRIFEGNGLGLSYRARQLTTQFLNSSNALMGVLGSLSDSQNSIEAFQTRIKALRASTPASKLSRALREERAEAAQEALTVSRNNNRGTEVDVEA